MKRFLGLFIVLSLFVVGCDNSNSDANDSTKDSEVAIANPASENCVSEGGQTKNMDVLIDGEKFGQYGVCEFDEGRMCEEWAMMNGDCPVGGVKLTGYVTEAARYCAMTGGEYEVTGMSGETYEQGTCTGKNGTQCEVWDYYRGACSIK